MAGRRGGKSLKKSAIPGVTITQFVEDIPKGCSTPDFERKPITLTLQEGKNAIFRAVVKGEPKPKVLWKRKSKEMDDPQKYQTSFIASTNEFILQINKITSEDADLYRCTAVNEYGEATCTTGLKIIQVGFKKKTKEVPSVPQADLKKEIQDFRKTLKKRAPSVAQKKQINMEQVWQLLLNADRKDYEKICFKYGIVDFRGMLRRLQEMKKEREDKQAQYVSNVVNLRHVRVNQEQRNASFDVEMDLKNPESRIYLYKDGQMINFGSDSDNIKHCLQQVGKKYNFIINDLQLEDAGVYQVKVEDVDIFSTELEAESIPVSFRYPLGELRCQEQGNAVFQCTLYDACFNAMWFHKKCRLEANDKYDISASKDGLTHRLVIKNTQPSDKGTYTIDIGSHSSSAWLEVEPAKGKRKQTEGDNDDKAGQQNKLSEEDHAKKFCQGVESENQEHFSMGKDGQHRNGQDGSGRIYDSFGKGKDGKMKQFSGAAVDMAEGDQFTTLGGNSICGETSTGMGSLYSKYALLGVIGTITGSGDAGGLQTSEGQDSTLNGAGPGDRFSRACGMGTQDSMLGSSSVDRNQHGVGAISGAGIGVEMPGEVEGFYGNQVTLGGPGDRLDGGLYSKDSGQGGASGTGIGGIGTLYGRDGKLSGIGLSSARGRDGIYGEDDKPGAVGITGAGTEIEKRPHGRDSTINATIAGRLGTSDIRRHYGRDDMPVGASTDGPDAARRVDGIYAKDGTGAGSGAGASGIGDLYNKVGMTGEIGTSGLGSAGGVGGLYGKDHTLSGAVGPVGAATVDGIYAKDGELARAGVCTSGIGGLYSKDGITGGIGTGRPGGAEGIGGLYAKGGMSGGAGTGSPPGAGGIVGLYGKDAIPSSMLLWTDNSGVPEGIDGFHGKNGMTGGTGICGPGGSEGVCGLCDKNSVLGGAGGPGDAGRISGCYSKGTMPGGISAGGPCGVQAVHPFYGEDGMAGGIGAGGPGDAVGIGGIHGKNGILSEAGIGGPGGARGVRGLCSVDGVLCGAGEPGGAEGIGEHYGEYGIPGGAGTVGPGRGGGVNYIHRMENLLSGCDANGPDGARDIGGFYGKDGMPSEGDAGVPGGTRGLDGLYSENGVLTGSATGGPGGAAGTGGLYSKDGIPGGVGLSGPGGAGIEGGLYRKEDMLGGAGADGPGGAAGIGRLYGKDIVRAGTDAPGGGGGIGGLYAKDGMPSGVGSAQSHSAAGVGGLYGKDSTLSGAGGEVGLCDMDDIGAVIDEHGGVEGVSGFFGKRDILGGVGGVTGFHGKNCVVDGAGAGAGAGGVADLYGKNGMAGRARTCGPGGTGDIGRLYGENGMLDGAGGVAVEGGLCGMDGMLIGVGAGGHDAAGIERGLYGKIGIVGGASAGGYGGGAGTAGLYSKDGMPVGTGIIDHGSIGGEGGFYSKKGVLGCAGGHGDVEGIGGLYGKDGMPGGTGTGSPGRAKGIGGIHGKDGIPSAACIVGSGGVEGVDGLFGKDGVPEGYAAGGSGVAGDMGGFYGKNGMAIGADTGGHGGTEGIGELYGKEGIQGGSGSGDARGGGGIYRKDGMPSGSSIRGPDCVGGGGRLYDKEGVLGGTADGRPGGAGVIISGLYGKDGMSVGAGIGGHGGTGGIAGIYGKDGMPGEAGSSGVVGGMGVLYRMEGTLGRPCTGEPGGARDIGLLYGKDGKLGETGAGRTVCVDGGIGCVYDRDGKLGGVEVARGARGIDGSLYEKMSGLPGEEFLAYGQSSGLHDARFLAGDRRRQLSDLDASGLTSADISRHRDGKGKERSLLEKDMSEPHCHFKEGLFDIHAQKGTSAVLSCILNNDKFEGTWFKDGFKITGQDQVSIEKDGPVHKLIIHKIQDSHAGKYKFEAEGVRTEASVFVEDHPNVDSALLEKLRKEPIVVKAGKNAMVKIPFEGQKPIRATWLKDEGELLDDARISTEYSDNFTRLFISSTSRKDCGNYTVKLKNESGSLEATFKLVVIDKPQPPVGPIEVVDSSTSGITIQWKPPKDDGGKPVQRYIIERQQVGRRTWLTLGETRGSCTIFTTNKVEHDKSYYFRVKAVNAEGTSEVLESDEVMAATKAFPGPPAPPKIVSANKGTVTLSWAAPHKTGNSRILGYTIEKCKKGSNTWTPVTDLPITARKYVVTDLKEGLQYEFRVAAINATGVGEASGPSEAAFARDPMKPPGPVRNLKVVSTDYCSISLSWMKPEAEEESCTKGYIVEMQHSDILKWTQCNVLPIPMTTYTVRGLKAREMYFLRVRAINDGGFGDPVELDTCVQTVPPTVHPRLLVKDTVKSCMIVKSGNTIRMRIPFEAFPTPDVLWLKDGLALPTKATVATREGLSQLIIPGADFSDSGQYTIILRTEHGNKVTFSFLVQVLDVPESPGPIQLIEKVPDTVTLIWEPSPTERREGTLNYIVMRRDSSKGSWQMVADLIYTNKCTVANFIPDREYFFRVLAKNCMGISEPSETVQPWSIRKEKAKFEVKLPRCKGINQTQPPRFLVQLKPHVVTLGFDCRMSCAVTGYPAPQVTWYKDGKNLSQDHTFFSKNDFGVCSLVIPGVTPSDGGQYKVVAINELGQAISKAELTIKEPSF